MSERLTEFPDRRVWDLTGFTLEQIRLGYQMGLIFCGPAIRLPGSLTFPVTYNSLDVRLEMPFTLSVGSDIEQIDPEQVWSTIPVLPLLHQKIASLTAYRNSTLLLLFENGTEIKILQDEQYESWHTDGEGELSGIGMLGSGHEGSPWGE